MNRSGKGKRLFGRASPKRLIYKSNASQRRERDLYDWITLATAICGVILVTVSAGISAWQAVLTGRELRVITGQQRAWVKIEPSFETALGIFDSGAWAGIHFNVTNIGTMPAKKAWLFARLYAHPPDNSGDWPVPDVCPKPQRYEMGQTILPGETTILFENPIFPGRAEIDTFEVGENIDFYLVACVQYETADEPVVRQTGMVWTVQRKNKDGFGEPFNSRVSLTESDDILVERFGVADIVE